jgi:hypothetical protein
MLTDDPIERVTAATDVLLSLASGGAAFFLSVQAPALSFRPAVWVGAFGCVTVSAAAGAAVHGLALPARLAEAVRQAVGLALVTAVSLFLVGVIYDAFGARAARPALFAVPAAGLGVFALSRFFPGLFLVFLLYEAAALAVALAAYGWLAATGALAGAGLMAGGIGVSMLAAGIQAVERVKVTLIWPFDHNGLFHLVQTAGLVLMCAGLSRS